MARLLEFELGTTSANRRNVRLYELSDPDEWGFTPYSQVRTRGDGRSIGFGFPVASWTWNTLTQYQIRQLLDLFSSNSDASTIVNIRTYTDRGAGQEDSLVTFDAIMHRPVDGEGKTIIVGSRLPTYSDVTVRFTRLEE
jgi:hypothetical protein